MNQSCHLTKPKTVVGEKKTEMCRVLVHRFHKTQGGGSLFIEGASTLLSRAEGGNIGPITLLWQWWFLMTEGLLCVPFLAILTNRQTIPRRKPHMLAVCIYFESKVEGEDCRQGRNIVLSDTTWPGGTRSQKLTTHARRYVAGGWRILTSSTVA